MSESTQQNIKKYPLRLRRKMGKRVSVLNFHPSTQFKQWRKLEMVRENNQKIYNAGWKEELPEFGAGSVYKQREREELRRAKFQAKRKEYKEEDQPWLLRTTTDQTNIKHFRGVKGGGLNDNSDHYIFCQNEDASIDVIPVEEWYTFQAHSRFKAMDVEEAEEQFSRRDKTLNFFSLKYKMKLKGEAEEKEKEEMAKKEKASLKISEMEEWMSSEDSSDDEKEDGDGDEEKTKKRKKEKGKSKVPPKNKKRKFDNFAEAVEDSDDGDDEGKECEYISDSSDSEPEDLNLGSVAEEKGLKKLLTDDESSNSSSDDEDKSDKENLSDEEKDQQKKEEKKEDKKEKKKNKDQINSNNVFDIFSSSSDEEDTEENANKEETKGNKASAKMTNGVSKKPTKAPERPPIAESKLKVLEVVRKVIERSKTITPAKPMPAKPVPAKPILANPIATTLISPNMEQKSTDKNSLESIIPTEKVRKLLTRRPFTIVDLLKQFKIKGRFPMCEVQTHLVNILHTLNPTKKTYSGQSFYSLEN